jgi:hypothetical protein
VGRGRVAALTDDCRSGTVHAANLQHPALGIEKDDDDALCIVQRLNVTTKRNVMEKSLHVDLNFEHSCV